MRKILLLLALFTVARAEPLQISGIYPHLAMFNTQGECGTGAVVPWADRLWVITYAPHQPSGSDDNLYEITPDLRQIIRPESIGDTPANRMIHDETNQLFIGPYAIDANRKVRAIPCKKMFGRLTGNARHLTDPAGKILYATMEEGIYEVDVKTLAVTERWGDEQAKNSRRKADLPGYHGKGFYSGQGVYIYSNNGAHGWSTEWPRIRDIGEDLLLMTMHGTFWKFPKTFTPASSVGISPRSNYLKVIGDFTKWHDRLVLGCDDTAKSEFLNKRRAKGDITSPQSQSNLWFIEPRLLDHLGPVIGRKAVWAGEMVKAKTPSDPFP